MVSSGGSKHVAPAYAPRTWTAPVSGAETDNDFGGNRTNGNVLLPWWLAAAGTAAIRFAGAICREKLARHPWRTFVLHLAGAAIALLCASTVAAAEPKADTLLKEIGCKRGLCVVLGEQPTQLALDLARASELTLYVQAPRADDAAAMRKTLDAAGLLGTRVYVEPGAWSRIHLADNLADAVIVTGSARDSKHAPAAELVRVLRPRGKLIGLAQTLTKPVPPGTGEWTHPYHSPDNNPQAEDQLARAPFLTRFLATPFYGPMPEVTVSSGGIVFKAFGHISFKKREWPMLNKLIALNGYNGTILWERDLKPGFMIHRNTMVATPDMLYLADDDSCKLIEPATGRIKDQIVLSLELADGPCWKWMTLENGVLYVLAGEKEQAEEILHGERTQSGWPWNALGKGYASKDYPWGFGKTLLAIDPATKKVLWKRSEPEVIDSRATTMKNGRIFIYSHQKHLTAVNASNGDTYWKTSDAQLFQAIGEHDRAQDPRKGYSTTAYLKSGEKVLYFSGPQRHSLVAVSVDDGRMLWSYPHGNYQLVIRDDALYAMGRTDVSRKFDPLTGKILAELDCLRGNCTRATGTADSIFARGDSHGGTLRLSVANNEPRRIPAMRPGCQDGVIAANGLLYWGPWMCDCNHSLVGVISLGPAGKFDFTQPAVERERLETAASSSKAVAAFPLSPNDWPTYRANNLRTAHLPVAVPAKARLLWQYRPKHESEPTAPVTAGGLVLVSGADGVVRAFDAASGRPRWTAYTGGAVQYPPTIANDRAYVGSGDGWIYCFEAATGRQLWRFRAAPVERNLPVYGRLLSTWPVASGVLVENGVAYAAAGIVSHDGTHVYALDAATGKIKWQNNTSGNLMSEGVVAGVSVQGHLLLNDGKLYLAGGNVVSPAIYDLRDGRCLNTLTNEWQKGPRGSELFHAAGEVRVVDKMMYSPRDYIPSRYFAKYLVQAASSDILIQGTEHEMMRVDLTPGPDGKPTVIWKDSRFVETSGVVLGRNAVLIIGRVEGRTKEAEPVSVLLALNPQDGSTLWAAPLPAAPKTWGLAVDRDGRIIMTLVDGRVLCYAG